ncbi:MAG TPA: hypothetical protein VNG31_01825 [Candidatus Baltobacteraceae bacterium]|nr:hypothetical protein [Candidatus Baltobacteraceae bacterium]
MKSLAIALAVIFVLCAILSILHPLAANEMTRALGFSSDKVHAKHPFLYFVLAVLALIWLRFLSSAPAR